MNILLIDIGNSRIKCSLSVNGKMSKPFSFSYDKSTFRYHFKSVLNHYKNKFTELYISSLDKRFNSLIKSVSKNYKINFISSKSSLPLKIDYTNTLGSDRICSAVAASKKFSAYKNILVIDLGTATTFNIISNGTFKGGMISAGLKTASEALLNKTTLPKVVLNSKISLVNKSTKSAIISGLVLQHVLFIEKAIELYKKLFKNLFVLITGGGSRIIGKKIKGVNKIEPLLVLKGLYYIAMHNQKIK